MNFRWLVWPITARVHCHANEPLLVVKVGQRVIFPVQAVLYYKNSVLFVRASMFLTFLENSALYIRSIFLNS